MNTIDLIVIAAAVIGYAVVSMRLERLSVTMPIVFVGLGVLFDATGTVELDVAIDQVALLAEVTLAIILFSDAVRMDVPNLRQHVALPVRLLLVGLPLTIAFGALITWFLLGDVSFWAAALIAAVLAPTDAAVGEPIVSDESVPLRIRQALNVESGLNDGLAVPAVLLFAELAGTDRRGASDWLSFAAEQIGGGILIGLAAGIIGAWLIRRARAAQWIEGLYAQLATLSIAVSAFAIATEVGANGFIAAFVAGLAYGGVLDSEVADHLDEYSSDTGALLAMIAFFSFGNIFVIQAFESLTFAIAVSAVCSLTIVRMLPVAIATSFMGLSLPSVAFMGWFGPRGLASILFGIVLLERELEIAPDAFDVIALTVVLSVVLHGLSSGPGAAAYGRWYEQMLSDPDPMPESERTTWRRARR
jgi:NhaP-type Na+/H+ or K+/H+ antiporter